MGKYIPVDPEKWAAMVRAMAENRLLKEENARLKAEVERLNDAIMRGASIPDAKPTDE
jgi:cell division protein FtsB